MARLIAAKTSKRDKYLKLKYGISEATYNEMLKFGNGACWICHRKPLPGKNLNVDHEHLTKAQRKAGVKYGKVRGLLDFFCNKYVVGRSKTEHAPRYRRVAAYLESPIDWRDHKVNLHNQAQVVLQETSSKGLSKSKSKV